MASKAQAVLDALVTTLSTNYSSTVHRPDRVEAVLFWPHEAKLDPTLTTHYYVRPGEERGIVGLRSCEITEILEVFILAATRHPEPSQNVQGEVERRAVVLDLVGDVKEKLQKDLGLGGVALDVYHEGMQVDYEHPVPQWAVAEMRLGIKYFYEKGERA